METIEELESKVIKALELIGDLRAENGRLESENETLRAENDQMKLAMEEKEKELSTLRDQLQKNDERAERLKRKRTETGRQDQPAFGKIGFSTYKLFFPHARCVGGVVFKYDFQFDDCCCGV